MSTGKSLSRRVAAPPAPPCPECGSDQSYQLGDGRLKCRVCRKKYSRQNLRRSLGKEFRQEVARLFWDMVPARRAAQRLGTNRKTVQRYYGRLRRAIAREQEAGLAQAAIAESGDRAGGSCGLGLPVFWMVLSPERLHIVIPERVQGLNPDKPPAVGASARVCGLVYAPSRAVFENLVLDSFRQKFWWCERGRAPNPAPIRPERFWAFAKDRLRRYRGGYQGNFHLFLQEMAFRFNPKSTQEGLAFLQRSLDLEADRDPAIPLEERIS